MTTDIFSSDQAATSDGGVLEALVGPGKKFATVEDLAKGKNEADLFIEQLKKEKQLALDGLKATESEATKTATIAELIAAVQEVNKGSEEGANQAPITTEQLQELVRSTMQGEKRADTALTNREQGNKLVLDKLNGDVEAAKTYVADRAKVLGMSTKQLGDLSESSPSAFAELMDIKPSADRTASPTQLPHAQTENLGAGNAPLEIEGTHTKAWFDAQKKELGLSKYIGNSKLQLEYMRAAAALGDRF
jgi:hypothetical protein